MATSNGRESRFNPISRAIAYLVMMVLMPAGLWLSRTWPFQALKRFRKFIADLFERFMDAPY